MAVMLIARFDGDVDQLRQAYDRAHALIMSRGGRDRRRGTEPPLRDRQPGPVHHRCVGVGGARPYPVG
jgi:hypothetical protein